MRATLALGLGLLIGIPRQVGPPAGPQQAPPTFRAGTDLVRLTVTVLDRDRHPVRGLTAGDFTITVDGAPQPIVTFAEDDTAAPISRPTVLQSTSSDVRDNSRGQRRLIAIVLDDYNIRGPFAVQTTRTVAKRIVSEKAPGDLGAVIFTMANQAAQDFTGDRARLDRAIDQFAGGPGVRGPLANQYSMNALLGAVRTLSALPEERAAIFLLSAATGGPGVLAPVPGSAFPGNDDFLRDLTHALTANLAHIPVYPICPYGNGCPTLNPVAGLSGGRAIVSNTPAAEVPSIFAELSSSYAIGYRPTYPPDDGHLRWTHIAVDRSGVTIEPQDRAQIAIPAAIEADPLSTALAGPVPESDLFLRVALAPFAGARGGPASVAVSLGLMVPVAARDAAPSQTVDLETRVFDGEGRRQLYVDRQKAVVVFRSGGAAAAPCDVLSSLSLPRGRYAVRIAARDEALGVVGSVYTDLEVPEFSKEAVSMSGVVLNVVPGPAAAPAAALAGIVPLVPTTVRTFVATDQVRAFLRVYEGGTRAPVPIPVTVRIVDANGRSVAPNYSVSAARFAPDRSFDLTYALPTSTLGAGDYLLSFSTSLGKVTATRDVPFTMK